MSNPTSGYKAGCIQQLHTQLFLIARERDPNKRLRRATEASGLLSDADKAIAQSVAALEHADESRRLLRLVEAAGVQFVSTDTGTALTLSAEDEGEE